MDESKLPQHASEEDHKTERTQADILQMKLILHTAHKLGFDNPISQPIAPIWFLLIGKEFKHEIGLVFCMLMLLI